MIFKKIKVFVYKGECMADLWIDYEKDVEILFDTGLGYLRKQKFSWRLSKNSIAYYLSHTYLF